jgi:signal transduction histidine kinase
MSRLFAIRAFIARNRRFMRGRKCVVGLVLVFIFGVGLSRAEAGPSIKFTLIPPENPGGPLTTGVIAGRVEGPHAGLKLVLYARSGRWYVQPFADNPFTTIQPDSQWRSSTHLGTEYAALLVASEYVPSPVADVLPEVGRSVVALAVTEGTPPFWRTLWFRLLLVLLAVLFTLAFYRWRMQQLARQLSLRYEERLAERTRIAQELHDTLLQGFLSVSMQLHVVTDQLPESSPAKDQLTHVLKLMGRVIEEGRNAVRGLRPSYDNPNDLEETFSRLQQELTPSPSFDFRIIVEGASRTLHPVIRDEVYRIGREALTNAFRHSGGDKIEVELEYTDHQLRVLVRDNGCGIDPQVLRTGRDGHFGLSGMHERAERIGAKLKIWSRAEIGTEVELSIPNHIAFRSAPRQRGWFTNSASQDAEQDVEIQKSETKS